MLYYSIKKYNRYKQMNLEQINKLIDQDMNQVNITIINYLHSDINLINQIGLHIIKNPGKRIRTIIAILSALALNYKGKNHIINAALVEFIHTATLLHDDVIDQSNMRRGQITANIAFGNSASILVGDFFYTRAFEMMTNLGSLKILSLMAEALNVISEGEVLQMINCKNFSLTESMYMNIIYKKTARLFEATCQVSSIIAGALHFQEKSLKNYGHFLGTAFQLIDDYLDYSSDATQIGKNIGTDLKEGKITLPLLHAIKNSSLSQAKIIRKAILNDNGIQFLEQILDIMKKCGSLDWTRKCAELKADMAISELKILPKTPWRAALETLAHISVNRDL